MTDDVPLRLKSRKLWLAAVLPRDPLQKTKASGLVQLMRDERSISG
jgi:hypothetical protein